MHVHRSTVVLVAGLAAAVTLTACGDDSTAETPTTTVAATAAPTTAAPTTEPSTTETPTTDPLTTEAPAALTGEEADIAAIYEAVFDSSVPAADKVDLIVDGTDLLPTIESYATAGGAVGGISVKASRVTIDGDTATIDYAIHFAGVEQYDGQQGELVNADGWKVSREQFCSIMASAQNACP